MISVCQIKFVLFVRFVFKHQELRIREICEIRVQKNIRVSSVQKNIRVIRVIRVQKNLVFKCAEKHSCYSNYYLPAVSRPSANLVFKKNIE